MADTTILTLPLIAASQAQKHITHNEALAKLDVIVQLSVLDILDTPPGSPVLGDRYIVDATATGDWVDHEDDIAVFNGTIWQFVTPLTGWRAYVESEVTIVTFDGGWTLNASDASLRDRATHTGTQAAVTISDLVEAVQDIVAAMVVAGTNMTLTYDDVAGTLTFDAAGGGGGGAPTESIIIAIGDETTPLTTGTAKVTFRMPYAFTLTGIRASLTTAQASGSIFTVDVNEGGASILSTKLTIDNTEKTSTTAATAPVISDTALADDAEITIDIDQIGNGTAVGLKVVMIGHQ